MKSYCLACIIGITVLLLSCSQEDPSTSGGANASDDGELPSQVSSLLKVIRDQSSDGQAKMDAILQLGELNDSRTCKPLIDILEQDMKERTGIWAAVIPVLGGLGRPEAVHVLLEALNKRDDHWLGREMAADALGYIAAPESVDALIAASYFADTRGNAIGALARIGDVRAVVVLIDALDEAEDPEIVESARTGLIKVGKAALPTLEKEMKNYSKEYPNTYRRQIVEQIINALKSES